jgi:hypothetical protein
MPDAGIRLPATVRDRLTDVAAAEGLSLRAYLTRLADTLHTPHERAWQAEGDDLDVHAVSAVLGGVVGLAVTGAVALGEGAVQQDEVRVALAQDLP